MKYTEYENTDDFLARAGENLERQEAVNGLMLGLSLRLRENKLFYGSQPLFATVGESNAIDLIVLMTPPHKLQILAPHEADEKAFEKLAAELHERRWPVPGVIAENAAAESFADKWTRITGKNFEMGKKQRIFELREVRHPVYPPGEFNRVTLEGLELAREWVRSFHEETDTSVNPDEEDRAVHNRIKTGTLWFWNDSQPVSMAARGRPTPNGEAVNMVYTPPERRRNGFATAVVARLSQRILDRGKRFCTLYTDLSNPVSNNIYMKIGYVPQADVMDIHFFD